MLQPADWAEKGDDLSQSPAKNWGKTCAGHLQWTTLLVSEKQWGLPSHITPHLSLAERKTQEHRKDTFKRRSTEGFGEITDMGFDAQIFNTKALSRTGL